MNQEYLEKEKTKVKMIPSLRNLMFALSILSKRHLNVIHL